MLIGALSDTHGLLPILRPCELLFICGDITPLKIQNNIPQSLKWFKNVFLKWADELETKQIILIGGNHDHFLQLKLKEIYEFTKNTKVKYLLCENYTYTSLEGLQYKIYGSPYCHIFGNWSFMERDEKIKEYMSNMDNDVDFLLTHDSPYGCSDILLDKKCSWKTTEHIGCMPIREIILEKKPKYNFKGHLHSTNHNEEILGETKVYTVSLLDEQYENIYEPLYLDI